MSQEGKFSGAGVLITGGLGFIGSNLARRLVGEGARVTLVDSLIPQYGGNPHNIADIRERVQVNVSDVRDRFAIEFFDQILDFETDFFGVRVLLDCRDLHEIARLFKGETVLGR